MANMETDNHGGTAGKCMKHDTNWRNHTQCIMNRLRDTIIPAKYLGRFNGILCTCPEHSRPTAEIDNPWETITDDQYQQAVTALDNHISSTTGNPHTEEMRKLLEAMRKDKIIAPANSSQPQPFPKSSALRMIYMLQQCVNHTYTIFFSQRQSMRMARENQKQKFSVTFELEGIDPQYIAQMIGWRGANIQPFQRQKKCGVTLEKKLIGTEEKVFAKIEKRCERLDMVEELKDAVQEWANERQTIAKEEDENRNNSDSDIADSDNDDQAALNQPLDNLTIQTTTTAAATGTSQSTSENTSVKELANQQSPSGGNVSNDVDKSDAQSESESEPLKKRLKRDSE